MLFTVPLLVTRPEIICLIFNQQPKAFTSVSRLISS